MSQITDNEQLLKTLKTIPSFHYLNENIQKRVLKMFFDWKADYHINTRTGEYRCRKCLNALLTDNSYRGAVLHYFRHCQDRLRRAKILPNSQYHTGLIP